MQIVEEIKANVNEEVEMKLGVSAVYSDTLELTSKEQALASLNEIKNEKITAYEAKKAEEEKAELARKQAAYFKAVTTTTQVASAGTVEGMQLSIPVVGSISSRFGSRGSSRSTIHTGLDISTSLGTGIRPIASGTVVYADYKGSYGNLVIVDHGNGVQSYYAHCSQIYAGVGSSVDSSTTIAAVGSTGNSTGPHLHLEIRINGEPVNPQNYLYN